MTAEKESRISTADAERLMKRCQVGVGGRNALNDAHDIMADCYGTIGALVHERDALITKVREMEAEIAKGLKREIMFSDIVHRHILAMRAAVVAGHLEGLDHGMQWIFNTLAGPGHLPNLEEARALGGAQAMFDAELREHEAFRAANPVPEPEHAKP